MRRLQTPIGGLNEEGRPSNQQQKRAIPNQVVFANDIAQIFRPFHTLSINGAAAPYIIFAADTASASRMIFDVYKSALTL